MHRFRMFVLVFLLFAFSIASIAQVCNIDLVNDALARSENNCRDTGRNQICIGNRLVQAEPIENVDDFDFQDVGDIEDLINFQSLDVSGFDDQTGDWGVAIMNIQANIPNTLPGQNVTFVLIGDVDLTVDDADATDEVQAFSLTTGIGRTNCNEVPRDAVLVQSPRNAQVEFTMNGILVKQGSTVLFWTEDENTYAGVYEGHVEITNLGHTETMGAGSQIQTPQDGIPREKTDFVYEEDPALTTVRNWLDEMYFTEQPCQIEVFSRTPVWNAPNQSIFRYADSGIYDVVGKTRVGDLMAWEINRNQINGGLNALQLWMVEEFNPTFEVFGNCENVGESQPNVPRVVPTTAPVVQPTTAYVPEVTEEYYTPHYAYISADPTNLPYSETCTTVSISVFHANSASLYISYYDASADVTVDQSFSFDLCDVPTGEHYLNLVVEDLGGNKFEYYYTITRADS